MARYNKHEALKVIAEKERKGKESAMGGIFNQNFSGIHFG
jgi:hypothetical protein